MPSTMRKLRTSPVLMLPLLLLACAAAASAGEVQRGRVYADDNGNGVRDPGEAGIAGVVLSNGADVVRSDAQGLYALPIAPGQTAFVIKPAQWRLPLRADGLPAFWRHHAPAANPRRLRYGGLAATGDLPSRVDFALRAEETADSRRDGLRVLVVADPQPKSRVDIDHYARDIVAPIRGDDGHAVEMPDAGLVLGDVVDDDLSLYAALNRVNATLGVPWMHAPGNHDLDLDAARDEDSLDSFRQTYGPDTYAWEEPEAVFVVLDDVVHRPGETPGYVGGLRQSQLGFLASYLSTVPRDRLLVLALHIPLFDTAAPGQQETFRNADRARLFALLQPFPRVLVLSGHRHTQRHHFHDADDGWHGATPLHEYNVGAASGAFWSGAPDDQGIPDATMADGTPNGHAQLQVAAGGAYRLSWHPARRPRDDAAFTDAMALHAPRVLRRGAYPAWGVYANVFMGDHASRVEYRIDGGEWRPMVRVARPDPRLLAENARDDAAHRLRGYDRSPEAEPSPHLWRGTLPTALAEGEHHVDVRAFDRWQGEQRASTRYRLQSAEP